ncbi:MAG: GDSL-type esterase/lipase family protein [Opitutaceae bacterium]|jgi:lysophospholipase L1-like esterase
MTHAFASEADFAEFDRRAGAGEKLSVVFLGGSLTWGAQATDPQVTSYRALISRRLEERYSKAHFRFGDAAIGGTGSQLAAFRLERDVLEGKPDLVFFDFTINDGAYSEPPANRLASYESLVRRLVERGIPVVQMILPAKKDVQPNPPARPLDAFHKAIGAAYGLSIADAVALAKQRVAEGKTTPDMLWDLPEDGTHPGDAGYALYAEAAWDAFDRAVKAKLQCRVPATMLHADTYLTVNRFRLSALAVLPDGWTTGQPHRNAITHDFVCSRWMDALAIAQPGAGSLRLKIRAVDVMLFGEQTPKSGRYQVRIDGGERRTYEARCADGNMRLVQIIAQGLDAEREHDVEITPLLEPGQELRIESVCVAGAPAQAVPTP